MRNLVFIFLTLNFSLAAWAKLPDDCRGSLNKAIASHFETEARFPSQLEKGEITLEDIEDQREDRRDVVQRAARQCSRMRKTELTREYATEKEINREMKKSYDQAIEFFERNIKLSKQQE